MGIPTMVHESNALPGVAVRQLQFKVDKILTNFKATEKLLKAKANVVNVGNPLRAGYGRISREEARAKLGIPDDIRFLILSFGGSLGAEKVNSAAVDIMKDFVLPHSDVMHIHAGGNNSIAHAKALYESAGLSGNARTVLVDYIYDMPTYMAAADLVICRAGAMTLTEIAQMNKAAIIIPSPNVTDNHQYKNARVLSDAKAAVLVEEKELSAEQICGKVEEIYSDAALREEMQKNIEAFASKDAGKRIYEEMTKLIAAKEKMRN